MEEAAPVLGVLLAGGLARRMGGGDKPLRMVGGVAMLERAIARLKPQCAGLILNANGDPARFASTGLPVVADSVPDFAGPLAGVLAGMDWCAQNRPDLQWIVTIAADTPFLPADFVSRLQGAWLEQGARIAQAASGGRTHPVNALWPVALRDELRHALTVENLRKVGAWIERYPLATAEWETEPVDPFFNANSPEDLAEADRLAAKHGL